ncbi:MAG: hypothetical protein V4732_19135 [Pseudomonadota bacterium]
MKEIIIGGKNVAWEHVYTAWDAWNKKMDHLLPYEIKVSSDYVISSFSEYWNDFIEGEKGDKESKLEGVYLELHQAEYPDLKNIINSSGALFEKITYQILQTEFIGYLVGGKFRPSCSYFLQSISSISVSESHITITGLAFEVEHTSR